MTLNESVESIDGAPELPSRVSPSASVQSVAGAPPISEEGAEGAKGAKGAKGEEDATGEQEVAPPSDEASAPPATPPTSVTKADARS